MLPLFNLTDPAIDIAYGLVILLGVYLSRLGPRLAALVSERELVGERHGPHEKGCVG
jgi:hypothetical protein